MVLRWRLTFLRQGQIFSPCICMGPIYLYGKNVKSSYFGHLLYRVESNIQLNQNLMSIRALMRHKIAKWANKKSKMATTAAILKISFWHLFSNLRSLWAETCSLATGWLLDRKAKTGSSKIQDGHNCSAPLNKMATRAKKIENLQTTSRHWPMACFQNICTEVFHQWPLTKINKMAPLGWTKWWPELKIEKSLKDISSAASVLITK